MYSRYAHMVIMHASLRLSLAQLLSTTRTITQIQFAPKDDDQGADTSQNPRRMLAQYLLSRKKATKVKATRWLPETMTAPQISAIAIALAYAPGTQPVTQSTNPLKVRVWIVERTDTKYMHTKTSMKEETTTTSQTAVYRESDTERCESEA